MRKSLFVLSLCGVLSGSILSQVLVASESETGPVSTAELKPTIAQGDAEAGKASSAVCAGCHLSLIHI